MYFITAQRLRLLSGVTILAFKLFFRRFAVLETNYVIIKKKAQFHFGFERIFFQWSAEKNSMKFYGNYKIVYD